MNISWKDVAHWGAAAALFAIGAAGAAGLHIPGVTIDPTTCFIAATGIAGAGLKSGVTSGKLAIALLAVSLVAVGLLLGATSVRAQTVTGTAAATVAAPATPATDPCTQQSCTTWYVGANLINDGANFDVIGSGLSGIAANGLMFGGDFGAQFWNGQWFAALEGDVEYDLTLNAPNNAGLGLSNSYALGAQVKLGYSLADLFGAGTSGSSPLSLPAALQNALISPYVAVGVWDRPWGVGLATGAGAQALIAQGWTLDAEYLHVNYDNAAVNPNVNEQTENLFLVGINRHFGF